MIHDSRPGPRLSSAVQSNAPSPGPTADDEDSEEEFVYPGVEDPPAEEAFVYHAESAASSIHQPSESPSPLRDVSPEPETSTQPVVEVKPAKVHPSPAQLESLQAASSSGDLELLKKLFRTALQTGEVEPFALANDASPRTGLTALHSAASRGYLDIVKWRE